MTACTPLCEDLRGCSRWGRVLPSYEDLILHLRFSDSDLELGRYLANWSDLQQHGSCSFCRLVVGAITQTCSEAEIQRIDPRQPIRIVIFPGEQILRLSFPSRFNVYLTFVGSSKDAINGPQTARLLPEMGIDPLRIASWLQNCDANHSKCSMGPLRPTERSTVNDSPPRPWSSSLSIKEAVSRVPVNEASVPADSEFRLIDLEDRCIRDAKFDAKYVALSYVWGNLSTFQLRAHNLEQLSKPESLDFIENELPRTIRDAIHFVKRLNIRYLWVDTLCLLQDNEHDVAVGISLMKQIFRGSYFTIVAGSAFNANAGLATFAPDLRDTSSKHLIEEVAPGVRMAVLHSIDWHLRQSVYNTRGWTLQELVLPLRTVVMINDQAYFRCQETNLSEELWAEDTVEWIDPDDNNISRIPSYEDGIVESIWAYQKLCEEYSPRKLRRDGDALRALHGVSDFLITNMRSPEIEGLPGYFIDHFLLFAAFNGNLRRRPAFASFSWAGWSGQTTWPRENFKHFRRSKPLWEKSQIMQYFAKDCFLGWEAVFPHGASKPLTARSVAQGKTYKLIKRYPQVRLTTHEAFAALPWAAHRRQAELTSINKISTSHEPRREDSPSDEQLPGSMTHGLDHENILASMWHHTTDPMERRRVQNRIAQRNYRERIRRQNLPSTLLSDDLSTMEERRSPLLQGLDSEPFGSYHYRPLHSAASRQNDNDHGKDPRLVYYKEYVLNLHKEGNHVNSQENTTV